MLPAQKDFLDNFSKGLLYNVIENKSWSNVCYTYRISNKLAGSVYKIALNSQLPEELQEWLKYIEFGHIYLGHYAKKQTLDFRFTAPKIKAVYERLRPLFDDPVSDIDNMYDIFEDYIFKMLRDWECLTKFFTEDEVRYLDTLYPDECIIDGQPVVHTLPQDVGYPPGLTANEYLLLILQNPEQWFTNQMSAMQQAMEDLKQRKQNNGTNGGCNTNQSGASSGSGSEEDENHNKEDRDRPKKNPPQNQQGGQNGKSGKGGQQNQQNNQQNGGNGGQQNNQQNQNDPNNQQNGGGQNNQPQKGMGTDQQNQDAAANTQSQEWEDGKNSKGSNRSNKSKQNSNDKQNGSSSSASGQSGTDDKSSEQNGQSGGGSSNDQGEQLNEQNNSNGGGSGSQNEMDNQDSDGNSAGSGGEESGEENSDADNSSGGSSGEESDEQIGDSNGSNDKGSDSEGSDEENNSGSDGNGSDDEGNVGDSDSGDGTEEGKENAGDIDGSGENGEDAEEADSQNQVRELTKEELQELIKQFQHKIVSDYQKMVETQAEQAAAQNNENIGFGRSGSGGAGSGTVLKDGCDNWMDFDGLEKQIRELMINRCITTTKRDLLYNYNRGRGCGDVLTPRYREQTTYDETAMTVVLDVSGSISEKNILGFVNIFKNVSKTCGKKCTIVMWDENLRAIYDSKDENIEAISGGGTDIGKGIKYVKEHMQPNEIGNLFVVSDCADYLDQWDLSGIETKYLVCWSSMDVIENYAGNLFNEFCEQFEKILIKSN